MSNFDEYIRQGEPGRSVKAAAWQTAIGLQDVDGLKPSSYLIDTAKRHIEGDVTIEEVKGLIDTYYKSRQGRLSVEEERTEEADKVSARITELLQEETFSFTPAEYQRIHRKLFAGIWQTHPFGEGNTRTTAVFLIKYLRSFGYSISNELFASHSWYFRNALVRANYFNREKGIVPTGKYLEAFLRNLILGEHNELRNRYLHVDYPTQSDTSSISKGQNGTLNVTLEELAVLRLLKANPKAKQTEIAAKIGKSDRTVKRIMDSLKEKGFIARRNGKRDGWWEVLIEIPGAQ